ncbi:MAG: SprT family zinc-dependent metalloprotease [Minisyncoccia bacterium]
MYTVRHSNKARHLRISIHPGGEVVVTVPKNIQDDVVQKFLQDKSDWIKKKVTLMEKYPKKELVKLSKKEIVVFKQKARTFVETKLPYFNTHYGYSWNTVSIRSQKTRWGSCSKKGNLNFNYKIALLPEHLADYIVVHELCHLGAFDHSIMFWNLVAKTIPDYKERRNQLKHKGISFQ